MTAPEIDTSNPPRQIFMPPGWESGDGTIAVDSPAEADDIEYVRRDPAVLATLPEVQALIAAKLEEAAKLIEPTEPGCGCVDCARCEMFAEGMFAEGIRALITPDMTAALAERDERIRREAIADMAALIAIEERK